MTSAVAAAAADAPSKSVNDLVLVRGDDALPSYGSCVKVNLTGRPYFVLHSEAGEAAEGATQIPADTLHVYKADSTGQNPVRSEAVGMVRVTTRWGWDFTPKLAVAFALKLPFLTPTGNMAALFSDKFGTDGATYLQWVPIPGQVDVDDETLLERLSINATSPSTVLELLEAAFENSNKKARSHARHMAPILKARPFRVASALHCVRNSNRDQFHRITLRMNDVNQAVHVEVIFVPGGARRQNNATVCMKRWNGDTLEELNAVIVKAVAFEH